MLSSIFLFMIKKIEQGNATKYFTPIGAIINDFNGKIRCLIQHFETNFYNNHNVSKFKGILCIMQ